MAVTPDTLPRPTDDTATYRGGVRSFGASPWQVVVIGGYLLLVDGSG